MSRQPSNRSKPTGRKNTLVRRLLLELALYSLLVVFYLFAVLRTLTDWLSQLSGAQPVVYAVTALALIVAQGWLLELVTSLLLERLGLE